MTFAPKPVCTSDPPEILADLRRHLERYPEAVFAQPAGLARLLRRPEAELEAAREWLITDRLELRA